MKHLFVLAGVLALLSGCTPVTLSFTFGEESRYLSEAAVLADPGAGADKVALIDVRGLISDSQSESLLGRRDNPVDTLTARLSHAARDEAVKAVILRISSPGGGVTASDMMYREIRLFREQSGKPVVCSLGEVAASGGYYVALAGDAIITEPTSITASIGVIIPTVNVSEGLGKIGIHARNLTSGPNKDMGDPLTSPREEHYALLQGLVDEFYTHFKNLVIARRPSLKPEFVDEVTDGRVITGARAVEVGLADRLGGVRDSFEEAKKLAGIQNAKLVKYYTRPPGPRSPYGQAQAPESMAMAPATEINLFRIDALGLPVADAPVAYYLWTPEP